MIQTRSRESTETPTTDPRIQWLGSGFGHKGSTSKRGAMSGAAWPLSNRLLDTAGANEKPADSPNRMMLAIMVLILMPVDSRTIYQDWESAMLSRCPAGVFLRAPD